MNRIEPELLRGVRMLVVTHVHFWSVGMGATLRVGDLIKELVRRGARIRVVCWGLLSDRERKAAMAFGIEGIVGVGEAPAGLPALRGAVTFGLGSILGLPAGRRPQDWLPLWILRPLKRVRGFVRRLTHYTPPPPPSSSLSDWRSESIIAAVRRACDEFDPDVVLVEYVVLAYVREVLPPGSIKVIDTHDVMHLRQQAHAQQGIPHWLNLSRDEETEALRPFDIVLAIQEEEAAVFRDMLPGSRIITCPPWFEVAERPAENACRSAPDPRLLVVGSCLDANVKGLEDFLRESWPVVRSAQPDCRLRVCGTVCWPFVSRQFPGVEFAGFTRDLASEYRAADLVISPVTFGGGIKIKCLEALAHCCACVFTQHSVQGLSAPEMEAWLVADDWKQFAARIIELLENAQRRSTLRREAGAYIRNHYGAKRSLHSFVAALDGMLAGRSGRSSGAGCPAPCENAMPESRDSTENPRKA